MSCSGQRSSRSWRPPIGVGYGLGVFELPTPCGPAWGHDGDFFGYSSIALTSPDGSRQVVVALNSDRILTLQTEIDLNRVLLAGYCDGATPAARAAAAATLRLPITPVLASSVPGL